jgi:hypothetical protein
MGNGKWVRDDRATVLKSAASDATLTDALTKLLNAATERLSRESPA